MLKICLTLFLALTIWPINSTLLAQAKWNISRSTHFIVHYKNAQESFIEDLIARSEDYYDKIAESLGFTRFNFWLWDNRAKIYIYDDSSDYQKATKQPSWSGGAAIPAQKVIYSFPYAKGFFDTILPHEMGHIIFREFVGFDNSAIPFWLDEGVASYQEKEKYVNSYSIVKTSIAQKKFISLESLNSINPLILTDVETAQLFYAEAVNIVDYLVKEFGKENFVNFCQYLRDKRDLNKALSSIYPFSNLKELSEAWQKHLK